MPALSAWSLLIGLMTRTPRYEAEGAARGDPKKHPKAGKKQIVHAAFSLLLSGVDNEPDKAKALHDFAITERGDNA
jgi:hypothetical protein